MLNTFKYVLLALMRNKGMLVWALLFPIVLSSCFMLMFSGLDSAGQDATVKTIIVEDDAYDAAEVFPTFIEAISAEDGGVLEVTEATSVQDAEQMMTASEGDDDPYVGYVSTDADGLPVVHLLGGTRSNSANMVEAYQAILVRVMDTFCSKHQLAEELLRTDPAALADPQTMEALFENVSPTQKVDATANAPRESVRYYFALLGMAAMFGAQAALIAISALLPSTSALGARRSLGGTSRMKALTACILASWALSYACLLVAYLYMRFVAGVDFGGRDATCLGTLAVASLMATALGALIGSLPMSPASKAGMLTGLVCFASLFAGLYGQPTMELADNIAAACPASQYINPAVQVSQAMYSLLYYDSFGPCLQHIGILLAMAAVFFILSARFLGRQRYESL